MSKAARTDNTMAKSKGRKKYTMVVKILNRKLKIEQHEPQVSAPIVVPAVLLLNNTNII
jgi:hypothetical protein